jgi:hypothetical protein
MTDWSPDELAHAGHEHLAAAYVATYAAKAGYDAHDDLAALRGAVDDPSKGDTAEELPEHVRTEHSTYSWQFEAMLERTGFDVLDRRYVRNAYGSFTCRRR